MDIFITYEKHFGLTGHPFTATPDPSFYFQSRSHSRTLAQLRQATLDGDCFLVLTGDVGAGKTMLLRKLARDLEGEGIVTALVYGNASDVRELFVGILSAFRAEAIVDSADALRERVRHFLAGLASIGKRGLIVVDEAQNLSAEAMLELIDLAKPDGAGSNAAMLVAGQDPLRDLLPGSLHLMHEPMFVFCHLGPLSEAETRAYVEHRLHQVGWINTPAFADDAFERIHASTAGVPRQINRLCHRLLMAASRQESNSISAALVDETNQQLLEEMGELSEPQPKVDSTIGSPSVGPPAANPQPRAADEWPSGNARDDAADESSPAITRGRASRSAIPTLFMPATGDDGLIAPLKPLGPSDEHANAMPAAIAEPNEPRLDDPVGYAVANPDAVPDVFAESTHQPLADSGDPSLIAPARENDVLARSARRAKWRIAGVGIGVAAVLVGGFVAWQMLQADARGPVGAVLGDVRDSDRSDDDEAAQSEPAKSPQSAATAANSAPIPTAAPTATPAPTPTAAPTAASTTSATAAPTAASTTPATAAPTATSTTPATAAPTATSTTPTTAAPAPTATATSPSPPEAPITTDSAQPAPGAFAGGAAGAVAPPAATQPAGAAPRTAIGSTTSHPAPFASAGAKAKRTYARSGTRYNSRSQRWAQATPPERVPASAYRVYERPAAPSAPSAPPAQPSAASAPPACAANVAALGLCTPARGP